MLKKYTIENGKLIENGMDDAQVHVYIAPDEAEKRYLIDQLKIDEHTLNSSLDPDELSRLEFEPEHIAIIFKRPRHYQASDDFLFKVLSAGVFVFKDRLIIVMGEEAPLFEGKPFIKIQTIQDVILKLLYRSISHFVEHLKGIDAMANEIEKQVNVSMENKYLINMFTLEKSLVYYLNGIISNGVLIEKLKNNAVRIGFSQENIEFLDDILIENNQCKGQADIYSQVLSSLMDARASIVSNNLNIRMKQLTIITIAIMLPTFVVSLFSMNVRIPLSQYHNAFWIISAMAAMTTTIVAVLWWKRRW
ncbi:MAG TPA: magnesium transporter CorA family protein [Anaerohalosphaeraceae bacterium]|nr:magnesium transporter CorA family protein [Anaerohalosphaeraceae bacterium]HPC64095.1 magnesium transporter CorA family protein [Anaerohalosphaeraceae bacterium]HPO69625.1 magnesium transporter CorA family protein [Anaerohalosphaeraceae bacterium]